MDAEIIMNELNVKGTTFLDPIRPNVIVPKNGIHYDSNEKVIGTWFGETLYEISGAIPYSLFTEDNCVAYVRVATALGISARSIISYSGFFSTSNYGVFSLNSSTYVSSGNSNKKHIESTFYYNHPALRAYDQYGNVVMANDTSYGVASYSPVLYITIQYTKTT